VVRHYLSLFRQPGVAVPFTAAYVARLPISMIPLGIVLLIQDVRGTYGIAGAVTGCFALGTAVGAPVLGRAMDLLGQTRVLLPAGVISAIALVALAQAAVRGASDPVLFLLSVIGGLSFPPITPAMRSAWRVLLSDDDALARAYAMDVVAVESAFFGGPILLSAALLVASPWIPLAATAGLLGAGTVTYALSRASRGGRTNYPGEQTGPGQAGPLRSPGVLVIVLVSLLMAVGFGHLDVAFPATAQDLLHSSAWVWAVFAPIAAGSVVGGFWFGNHRWTWSTRRRLPVFLWLFAGWLSVLTLLVAVLGARMSTGTWLILFLPALFATGVHISPSLIMQQSLVDELAPSRRLAEAQGWLNAGLTTGGALGAAIGGVLIDVGGSGTAFVGATGAVVVAALTASVMTTMWNRPPTASTASTVPTATGGWR
jgi:MFS family permease